MSGQFVRAGLCVRAVCQGRAVSVSSAGSIQELLTPVQLQCSQPPTQVSKCMLGAVFESGLNAMEMGRAVWFL